MLKTTDNRLCSHHVGARAGTRAFPSLPAFEKDIVNVLYEADEDCVKQIYRDNKKLASELHVLPYCLAGSRRQTTLNINYDPYTSSLYEENPDYAAFYSPQFFPAHDYILGETLKPMEKRAVETQTLDEILASDPKIPLPDILSIDTEGSEFDILTGAQEALRLSAAALILEVAFHPIRKNQKLFGELLRWLDERGFYFAKFIGISEASPFRAPVGLRAEGFQIVSDALFLRKTSALPKKTPKEQQLILAKLAFISIIFNQTEYALKALQLKKASESEHGRSFYADKFYLHFLEEFEKQAEKMPYVYPETFGERYTYAESKARFEAAQEAIDEKKTGGRKRKKAALSQLTGFLRRGRAAVDKSASPVEALLRLYGLCEQADVLKEKRAKYGSLPK